MRLLRDESLEGSLIAAVRRAGHDVVAIAEVAPGVSDIEVLRLALELDLPVVTNDKDFGDHVVRGGVEAHGVILLRFAASVRTAEKSAALVGWLAEHEGGVRGNITVITPTLVRIRSLELPQ